MNTSTGRTGLNRTTDHRAETELSAASKRRDSGSFTKYIGYSVSCVSFCAGMVFLTGVFIQASIPAQLRIMCGIVFMLLGVYRFFATRYRIQAMERGDL